MLMALFRHSQFGVKFFVCCAIAIVLVLALQVCCHTQSADPAMLVPYFLWSH